VHTLCRSEGGQSVSAGVMVVTRAKRKRDGATVCAISLPLSTPDTATPSSAIQCAILRSTDYANSPGYVYVSELAVRVFRLRASRLLPQSSHPVSPLQQVTPAAASALCRELLGLQAQDTTCAALSIWNRLHGPFSPLTPSRQTIQSWFSSSKDPGRMVRCHGQRGTLHVYDPGVTWPLTAAIQHERLLVRRQKSAGAEALDNAIEMLRRKLECGANVSSVDLPTDADFALRYGAFMSVCLAGYGGRVDLTGRTIVAPRSIVAPGHPEEWILPAKEDALRDAARVYFSAFAPATEQDFRYYLGINALESRYAVQWLRDAGELHEVHIMSTADVSVASVEFPSPALVMRQSLELLQDEERRIISVGERLPLLLLGRFDVLLLGHVDKSWIVPPAFKRSVWSNNADVSAVVLVGGRACGVWKHTVNAKLLRVNFSFFDGVVLSLEERHELDSRVEALARSFFSVDDWEIVVARSL
jgi:Winged helix DNA-binding domain